MASGNTIFKVAMSAVIVIVLLIVVCFVGVCYFGKGVRNDIDTEIATEPTRIEDRRDGNILASKSEIYLVEYPDGKVIQNKSEETVMIEKHLPTEAGSQVIWSKNFPPGYEMKQLLSNLMGPTYKIYFDGKYLGQLGTIYKL